MELSNKSELSKPSKFKKNFLYKLFHKKKGNSRTPIQNTNIDNNATDVDKTKIDILLPISNDTSLETAAKVTEDVQLDKCTPADFVATTVTESPSLSVVSHVTGSSDSMKRAREIFFEPLASKSESDSGCPDEEKKQDEDYSYPEEFVKISSHTFKQLQNEVIFLRGQLAALHKLFCTEYEVWSSISIKLDQMGEAPISSEDENL